MNTLTRDEISTLAAMVVHATETLMHLSDEHVAASIQATHRITGHILFSSKADALHFHMKLVEKLDQIYRETQE